jgi:hypothetical protein
MKQLVASNKLVFDQLFSSNVNLTPSNYVASPGQVTTSCCSLPLWFNLAKGPLSCSLEHFHGKWFVGLWVPARVSPERTSNLERGLSAGLVVSTKLFTLVGGA